MAQDIQKTQKADATTTKAAMARRSAAATTTKSARQPEEAAPKFDSKRFARDVWGPWAELRKQSRELAATPEMVKIEGLSLAEHRQRAFAQMKIFSDAKLSARAFPEHVGGNADAGGNIAAFEELLIADPSLQIKAGVQWGLFGAAVLHLGTAKHHEKYLPGIISLDVPGAFAMTETGHGSDVASIATTATYDEATGEFVLNTPFRGAWKDYLGNAAIHGRAATVFAQLITRGVNHGVHCFYVPIRDENGEFLEGVGGEDDGLKGGLNGIDNGRLHFTDVRVPRFDLLDRYGQVAEDGSYSSPIASPGRRFFTMLGTLVQGRVSLDGSAVLASKMALTGAIRYASERRQFTSYDEQNEEFILDYGKHQRRLIPRLAETIAMQYAHHILLNKFHEVFSNFDASDADREDLETLAAALKPLSTWHALDTLQEAREASGGAGFLTENRFTSLRADLDIYVTFEGDNNVLLQLVGKRLLTDFAKRLSQDAGQAVRILASKTAEEFFSGSGLRTLAQNAVDLGSIARSVEQLREGDQHALLTDRVETMVAEIAARMRNAPKMAPKAAADLFNANQSELIEAARAHGELLQWEAFTDALKLVDDEGTKTVLTWLRDIFGLSLIERHLAWYLIKGRLSAQRAKAVTAYIDRLIARVRPYVLDILDGFELEDRHLRMAIATGAEAERQTEARNYQRAQAESGEAPVHEKKLYADAQKKAKTDAKRAAQAKAKAKS